MGTAGQARQGLWIQTRTVVYTPASPPGKPKVDKYSEITLLLNNWGPGGSQDPAQVVHDNGLKIGMCFHTGHAPTVAWAADTPGNTTPQTLRYTTLPEINTITSLLNAVFTANGKWQGYRIPAHAFPLPGPKNVYFKTTIDNFNTKHALDVHFVPVVVVLDTFPDFTQHYAAGLGMFTRGKTTNAFELDSQTLTNL